MVFNGTHQWYLSNGAYLYIKWWCILLLHVHGIIHNTPDININNSCLNMIMCHTEGLLQKHREKASCEKIELNALNIINLCRFGAYTFKLQKY